jgi:hypothetical protein
MLFIIRALFWIGVVLLLLPAGTAPRLAGGEGNLVSAAVGQPSRLIGAAVSACVSRPRFCRDGIETAQHIGVRLEQGAMVVADLATDASGPSMVPGPIPLPPPRPTVRSAIAR